MRPRINIVTLGVADMAGQRAFYERLGFTASSASNPHVTFFAANGLVLALFGHDALAEDAHVEANPAPAFRGQSLAWNVASAAEVDTVLAHAQRCGGRLLKPGQKVFWGGYSGYFADPEGHLWEVAFNPFFPLDAAGHVQLP
jgi:catechol 2,3-dioxygenase-like lactoylglutathione lyase family enzyme